MSSEVGIGNHEEIISDDSTEIDLNLGNDSARVTTTVQQEQVPDVGKGNEENCSKDDESNEVNIEEPYVGQEFDSEDAAHSFYTAYAMRMGFIVRMDCLRRSRDGTVIKRTFVCNKEGYRRTNRSDENSKRPRKPFRMGCKAKLSLRRLSTGIWIVTKFIKEHAHPLPGSKGQNELNNDQTLNESARIKELTKQLLRERKRSASFRKIIDLLFSHIKEHTEELSRKIQCIADKVNEIDSMGKNHQETRR
ncbi:protein FAR1-RELATED SEQUENCE 5 [Morus notabilis]|uniref:protein FAR1-RELATED SEQUENCE 5 n=1 Tax=Morus notabilis TaxID=981085 RepID=UPI000CED31E5|nr:protein FAR1-RELATED SEQUENCE 5 [Morus notabilis]